MKITTETDKITGETFLETVHSSGLCVKLVKKPGKSRKTAMIAANFGSINREFEYNGNHVVLPNGTAHFLEHKLFEGKNGNAFDFYAKTGAKANAFTSNDKTAYYFICTDKFEENLSILLSFVSNPYLTDENVQKEKGIIGQEIKMYDDEPSWQGYMNLVTSLYKDHPVKYDIAGSVEDIAPITPDILMSAYNTFYSPANLVLCVAGDVEMQTVLDVCDKCFTPRPSQVPVQTIPKENPGILCEYKKCSMPVSRPQFYIGIKDNDTDLYGYDIAKKEVETQMLLDMLFGNTTPFYKDLYDKGILNDEYDISYECSDTFAFCLLSGETDDPAIVLEAVKKQITDFFENGCPDERFIQMRNAMYGSVIKSCDSVTEITGMLVNAQFSGRRPFDKALAIKNVTQDDITARAEKLFRHPDIAMSVVECENN